MEDIRIRDAEARDIEDLSRMYAEMYDILRSFGLPYMLNEEVMNQILEIQLKARLIKTLVAEYDGMLVGFVTADIMKIDRKLSHQAGIIGHIKEIYVKQEFRGLKVSHHLLDEAEKWTKENGASILECNILVDNLPALRFWESKEYTPMGMIYYKEIE